MIRYQLVKLTRRIRIMFGGYQKKEAEHKLFLLFDPKEAMVRIEWLGETLRKRGYYYNCLSTTYRKQIYTVRRLLDLDHQIHLRFYSDGWVSGHYELRPEHPLEHLEGVELRLLSEAEKAEVRDIFDEANWQWPSSLQ